ncbi:reverse transcriptase domain-containing protein [Tanacetum coccineum]
MNMLLGRQGCVGTYYAVLLLKSYKEAVVVWGRNGPQGLEEPMSDEILREMCDKNYHQLLPLIAEKMQKEKEQKDKLNARRHCEGSTLTEKKGRKELCTLLKRNLDIFAGRPAVLGRGKEKEDMGTERNKALQEEWKLSGAGIMNMTDLANVCGFKDLTTHAPTIRYPLPEIDEGGVPLWDGNVLRYKSKHHRVVKACPIKQTRSLSCHLEMHQGRVRAKWGKFVLVEELKEKSIHEKEILDIVEEEGNTWMTPIREYLTKEILPEDKKKARAVRRKAVRYAMINGTLYKKSFLGPWLRCVGPLQANYVLREIHEGSCSMHSGPRSVVAKVIQTGYYWPTMHMDARNLIRECNDCQIHRPVPRNPQQNLTPITSPWPFYKWGIDIAGPFPEGPGKVKFLIVAIDYFTKWIEAKAVATITGSQVKKFVWDNIVCRFGLPGEIISDNGKQFRDNPFKDWCEKLCIRQCFASVKHPQANGLVERANRSLGEGIKARLDEKSKDWIEELPHVLWAHRTMIKSSNGETPFSLTYGTEAVIPAEIGMPTLRTAEIDQAKNNEALGINLDLIEERREQAAIQEAKSKKKMERYNNSRVCETSFKPGDMVYRSNEASHAKDEGKLGPKWEGPYEVKESLGKGAYKLKDRKGNEMPRTWNICNLKKCYIHEV